MEDRDRVLLAGRVLRELLVEWQQSDPAAVEALEMLSLRMGPDGARGWLMRCAMAREAWFGKAAWQPPMQDRVKQLLGMPADASADALAADCADGTPGIDLIRQVMWSYDEWGATSGRDYAGDGGEWLLGSPEERFATSGTLLGDLFNDKGLLKHQGNMSKKVDGVPQLGGARG